MLFLLPVLTSANSLVGNVDAEIYVLKVLDLHCAGINIRPTDMIVGALTSGRGSR